MQTLNSPDTPTQIADARGPVIHAGSNGEPFPQLVSLIDACSRERPPEVLIFGDSVMTRTSRHDKDSRNLGEMLAAPYAGSSLVITRSAFNPTLAHGLVKALARLKAPKVLVLPVNIRCFSPQWDLHPAWTFKSEFEALEAWLADPSRPIAAVTDVHDTPGFYDAYDRTPVQYELSRFTTIGEFRRLIASQPQSPGEHDERVKQIFVLHYTHRLSAGHRKLASLVAAAEGAANTGIHPIVYLTPINVEAGEKLAGRKFRDILAANVETLTQALAKTSATVMDLTELLPARDFFHEQLVTEHLNENGRKVLTDLVCKTISEKLAAADGA